MSEIQCVQSLNGFPTFAGRRKVLRALGAAGTALAATLGNAGTSSARKKRRKKRKSGGAPNPSFSSVLVEGASSDVLPVATGSLAGSQASCSGPGKLLGGSYRVNGTADKLVNVLVVESAPNFDGEPETFFATMRRTSETGSTAGATIVAYALCIP